MLLTQTNWLRMPARELGSSFDAPNGVQGVGTTLLKKHKILPHPREERLPEIYPSTPAEKPRTLVIDTGVSSTPSSDTSSPHTLKHASKNIGGLPPTPPTHSRQSSGSHSIISAPRYDVTSSKNAANIPSIPSTPPNQRSPPTPDVTPPRAMPLAFRPPPSDHYPSSRTDSFKTARENPCSSDEDEVSTVRPILPSARQSATEVPRLHGRVQKRKEVGLGLGLESDNEGATTPRAHDSPQPEFHVFDGEWGSETSEVEREWDDNLMRNVTVRKRPARRLQMFTGGAAQEVLEDDIVSPTNATKIVRSLPLQERIARHRLERETDRLPNDRAVEHITSWPSAGVDTESPTTPDVRRFSAMSGRSVTSAVVEAMVVDGPPSRRKTLRHTKKQFGLREFGSDQSTRSSAPNSVVSTSLSSEPHRDSRHRLHHSTGRIPEVRHRSLASNVTVSTASSSGRSRREVLKNGGIPVVVIPDRHSSTKSSNPHSLRSTSSHKSKRSNSLTSAPLSHSSKFNEPGYFDSVAPRKRTMSESASDRNSIRTIDHPPKIPARRSSLSAPTSRNTSTAGSRTGSLTAESLKAHNMIQALKQVPAEPEPVQAQRTGSQDLISHSSRLHVDHNGDPFFGNRLSTQVTPFSQASYETAGTSAEVSEAMAVTIFPHQNKSVLVVQQLAPTDPSPLALNATGAAQPAQPPQPSQPEPPTMTLNGKVTGPVTPPQPIHPMDEVDSPLRNPRIPPEPPKIAFIPPTPNVLEPGQEDDRQLGFDINERPSTSDSKPKRGLSLMRRAFSTRRNSEPALHLGSGLLKRTFSLSARRKELADEATQTAGGNANPSTVYPSVTDRPADGSKLHPFWRPSHFWDDLDNDFADDELGGGYPIIDNRPDAPKRSLSGKLKRTFAILPTKDDYEHQPYVLDRREMRKTSSGNLRVVKQRSNSSLRREASNRRHYAEVPEGTFGHGFKDGNGGRIHTIPGIGVRVEYIGWSGMKRRLSEKRRQQRSEKLRATISPPKEVQSGMDDVLRRRQSLI